MDESSVRNDALTPLYTKLYSFKVQNENVLSILIIGECINKKISGTLATTIQNSTAPHAVADAHLIMVLLRYFVITYL